MSMLRGVADRLWRFLETVVILWYNDGGDNMRKYDAVLFDLDGTITASAQGVRRCIELTLEKLQKPCPDLSDYSTYIGPPLDKTFANKCGLGRQGALEALPIYRDYYDVYGTKENRLYDGITEVFAAVREAGMRLAVCTSKNERLARDVTNLLGITTMFDAICGSLDSGARKEKPDLIPYAMHTLGVEDASRVLMVGDTHFDTLGAKACGVDFVGVLYGYGKRALMEGAGAKKFAATPAELLKYIL